MSSVRVDVRPELLRWARERARISPDSLARSFPKLAKWEDGTVQPTLKQLEDYARRTGAPIGYFFLKQPPDEPLPIPDFRTIRNQPVARPSANLLNTIYLCQNRQEWYRQHLRLEGAERLAFVGSLAVGANVVSAAETMRATLQYDVEARTGYSFADAFREFRRQAEDTGVLVMSSGVVGNASRHRLDPDEFRGFTLVDPLAPVVFINSSDSTGAQLFTLAHELVHVWSGRSGVTDAGVIPSQYGDEERWCNSVAAELLVPLNLFMGWYDANNSFTDELERLARLFKVSTLVILRRLLDTGILTEEPFWKAYWAEVKRIQDIRSGKESDRRGELYNTEIARVNRYFAAALVTSTLEGHTTYTEAFRLLSIKNVRTLREVGRRVGVIA